MLRPVLIWLREQYPHFSDQKKVKDDYQARLDPSSPMFEDLRRFCYVYETTNTGDRQSSDNAEGRRQTFLHLIKMLELDDEMIQTKPRKEPTDGRDESRGPDNE